MDLEPLISHQFHYCVQRTSTYFNVFQRDHGQDGRLQAASRSPGSKSKAHLSDTPKHLSFQVFKSLKTDFDSSTLRPHGVHGAVTTISETPKQLQQDLQDAAPFRLSLTSLCHLHHLSHLSMSLNTSLQYKTCSKLIKSRLHIRIWMHSRHSDDAM